METETITQRIRVLNDEARQYLTDGTMFVSRGVAALPADDQASIIERVRLFDDFTPENDPHGEHDFGAFEHDGRKIFWKIDYYDPTFRAGSPAPENIVVTRRVLTVMLADEY
jgi:Protein of unknown function (DUF3768)